MVSTEFFKRSVSGTIMLIVFLSVIMQLGHYSHLVLIFLLQAKAFEELQKIGLTPHLGATQVKADWLLFFVANATMLVIMTPTASLFLLSLFLYVLVLSFWIVAVLNKHNENLHEYILHYSWIHLVLLITAPQTVFISLNLKLGLFWFVFPALTVIINDISAYLIGKRFGKHQLISLSPNKTIEGFMGAAVSTVTIGYFLALFLSHCDSLFNVIHPVVFQNIGYHGLVIASVTSVFAPIGGFLASAFKRAGKVKDFDSIIPGHGGISDRVDGHMFIAIFTYLYYQSIIAQ